MHAPHPPTPEHWSENERRPAMVNFCYQKNKTRPEQIIPSLLKVVNTLMLIILRREKGSELNPQRWEEQHNR